MSREHEILGLLRRLHDKFDKLFPVESIPSPLGETRPAGVTYYNLLHAHKETLETRLTELEKIVMALAPEVQALTDEVAQLKAETVAVATDIDSLNTSITDLQKQISDLQAAGGTISAENLAAITQATSDIKDQVTALAAKMPTPASP